MKRLKDLLNEELEVKVVGTKDNVFYLVVNGKKYGYEGVGYSAVGLNDKFKSIAKHSVGRALAWLKKNSKLVSDKEMNEKEVE